jgi:hypothetical protein
LRSGSAERNGGRNRAQGAQPVEGRAHRALQDRGGIGDAAEERDPLHERDELASRVSRPHRGTQLAGFERALQSALEGLLQAREPAAQRGDDLGVVALRLRLGPTPSRQPRLSPEPWWRASFSSTRSRLANALAPGRSSPSQMAAITLSP